MVDIPQPIATYLKAQATDNADLLDECFAPDAQVQDEGATRSGVEDIKAWMSETRRKYNHTTEPLSAESDGDTTVLRARVSGDFPGSPITLDYAFEIAGGRITRLGIA